MPMYLFRSLFRFLLSYTGVYKETLSLGSCRDARFEHLCTDFSPLNSLFGALPMTFGWLAKPVDDSCWFAQFTFSNVTTFSSRSPTISLYSYHALLQKKKKKILQLFSHFTVFIYFIFLCFLVLFCETRKSSSKCHCEAARARKLQK